MLYGKITLCKTFYFSASLLLIECVTNFTHSLQLILFIIHMSISCKYTSSSGKYGRKARI